MSSKSLLQDDSALLEISCAVCLGKRMQYDRDNDSFKECPACNGSGFVPTAIGARILDLIRHNSRVKISAELQVSSAQ